VGNRNGPVQELVSIASPENSKAKLYDGFPLPGRLAAPAQLDPVPLRAVWKEKAGWENPARLVCLRGLKAAQAARAWVRAVRCSSVGLCEVKQLQPLSE
jgi:hypothetical protein